MMTIGAAKAFARLMLNGHINLEPDGECPSKLRVNATMRHDIYSPDDETQPLVITHEYNGQFDWDDSEKHIVGSSYDSKVLTWAEAVNHLEQIAHWE